MVNILVTGGCGFIGSHLVQKLREKHFVRVLDLLPGEEEGIEYVVGDVRDERVVERALKDIDIVYHLAAQISAPYSFTHPRQDCETNVVGTVNLLKFAQNVERFIYASTSSVYGKPAYLPVDENHPTRPTSPYGLSKLCAEKYCELFSTLNGFSLVIVRLQSPYGVGMRGVVLTFLKRALNGEQITIFGDGSQTRTYLYISDVIAAYVALINRGHGVYNITHTQEIAIKDLAEKILKLTNSPSKIRYTKAAQEEEILPRLSIDKARREIGWSPTISIDVGLSLMIKQLKAV